MLGLNRSIFAEKIAMRYLLTLLTLPLLCLSPTLSAQPGCPDPQAINFSPSATGNDGSCLYPITNYTPLWKVNLPSELKEISGLVRASGRWWSHTDSGTDPEFFNINPETGDILQTIQLKNAKNRDWEDITADNQFIYLGDFGNNTNDRTNLGIYRVPISKIGTSKTETVDDSEWLLIPFAYADQTSFETLPEDSTEFDCEAMTVWKNKIHIFTKNRKNFNTSHYVINQQTGLAEKIETFDAQGLITAADVSPDGKLLVLLGYDLRPFLPTVFMWLLWDQPAGSGNDLVFTGNKRRIELGTALAVGQTESLGFADNRMGYIANERTDFNGVTLAKEATRWFDLSAWVPQSVGTSEAGSAAAGFRLTVGPFSQTVHFQFTGNQKPKAIRVINTLGQSVMLLSGELPEMLNTSTWPSGLYLLEAIWENTRASSFIALQH